MRSTECARRARSAAYVTRELEKRHGADGKHVVNEVALARARSEHPKDAAADQHHAGDLYQRAQHGHDEKVRRHSGAIVTARQKENPAEAGFSMLLQQAIARSPKDGR